MNHRPSSILIAVVACALAIASPEPASSANVGTSGSSARLDTAASTGTLWLDLASNEEGLTFAAWGEYAGGQFRVYASRSWPGEAWSEPRPIGLGVENESFPEVAVGPDGYAFVSWNTFNFSSGSNGAFVTVFSPFDGWRTPTRLSAPGNPATRPAVAAISGGRATVLWPEEIQGNTSVFARSFSPASGWSSPLQISTNPSRIFWVDISAITDGRALAVWIDTLGVDHLNGSTYSPATGWSGPTTIATGVTGSSFLVARAAMTATSGDGVVAWIVSNDAFPSHTSRAAGFDPTQGWGSPLLLSANATTERVFPAAGTDDAGLLHVVFLDKVGGFETLYERGLLANGSWGGRTMLSTTQPVKNPWLASSANGGLVAVWIEPDGLRDVVRAKRFLSAEGWGAAALVTPDTSGRAWLVAASADRSGNTVVAWSEDRGGSERHAFAVWLREPLPPTLVVNEPSDGERFDIPSAWVTGRTEPLARVLANGVAGSADAEGNFSVLIPLIPGTNTIEVEASDEVGNRNATSLTVMFDDPLPSFRAELAGAQADLDAALANLTALQDELNGTQAALDLERRQLAEAEANLSSLQANASASSADLDQARADLDANRLRVTQLEVKLNATKASLDFAQADLDDAFLRITALEADRQRLNALVAADNATEERIVALEDRLSDTQASVASAQLIGLAGVGVGAVGLIAAATAVLAARRHKPPPGP